MTNKVLKVEAFIFEASRESSYIGDKSLKGSGEYFVLKENKTVYATTDRTVIVRIETGNGVVGWGETYGLICAEATIALINDFMAEFVVGQDPADVSIIYENIYNMMRCRGYNGGYYHDALAAIDIALWDVLGKIHQQPIYNLLGGQRRKQIPAYVSGLPKPTLAQRIEFAKSWQDKGFVAFKFASPAAGPDLGLEMKELRAALGTEVKIACDLQWAQTAGEASAMIASMQPYNLWFAEAPVATENIAGLKQVANSGTTPIAVGEEWRTIYDAQARISAGAVDIIQPEMGHVGITQFMRMGTLAQANHLQIIPHATIGSGIFLAASLQVACCLENVTYHEYQHAVFDQYQQMTTEGISVMSGYYSLSNAPGLGIEPSDVMLALMKKA